MEKDEIIRNSKELAERLEKAMKNGEAFSINATFDSSHGPRSVFFIGGRIEVPMIQAHLESFNSMLRAIRGEEIKGDSIIKQKKEGSYEKKSDGSFKLTFNQDEKPQETM